MSTPTKKVAYHTLGCKLNFSETSSISRDFIAHGYEKVSIRDFADIYVINTCSVTENANRETRKLTRRCKRINSNAIIVVTHYQRLLNYIVPDFVHVLVDGKIINSGDKSLALELEEKGYDKIIEEAAG